MTLRRIYFEYQGQIFLWWDINSFGVVQDAGPFQKEIWIGAIVDLSKEIKPGNEIKFFSGRDHLILNHKVKCVKTLLGTDFAKKKKH